MNTHEKAQLVRELVSKSHGKFITVTFRKKSDGSLRTLNGRTGVGKYVKGTGQMSDKVIGLWCPQEGKEAKAYRSFNPETVLSMKVDGIEVNF